MLGEAPEGILEGCQRTRVCGVKVTATLLPPVLGHSQHVWLNPDQNTERTVLSDTVVANSHRTLRTNKVYFLTGT